MKNNKARFRQQKRLTALKRRRRVSVLFQDRGLENEGMYFSVAGYYNRSEAKVEAPHT